MYVTGDIIIHFHSNLPVTLQFISTVSPCVTTCVCVSISLTSPVMYGTQSLSTCTEHCDTFNQWSVE